jgi:hypothetical protein
MTILGLTLLNNVVEIPITSCPVRINNDYVVRKRMPGSELIYHKSIHRKDGDIEEYSYVFNSEYKFIGYVVYHDGFKLYKPKEDEFVEIPEKVGYMPNKNIKQMTLLSEKSDPIEFSIHEEKFLFKYIVGCDDYSYLVFGKNGIRSIEIKDESEVQL